MQSIKLEPSDRNVGENQSGTEGKSQFPGVHQPDLICFSHLRWHFVYQRPQHLLSRCALQRRVFFWEEPIFDDPETGYLEVLNEASNLWVIRPHIPNNMEPNLVQERLLSDFIQAHGIFRFVRWYYNPMALRFTAGLQAEVTVYDCMDELSGFAGAAPEISAVETELFSAADVVFTGGVSLFEAKRNAHQNVHAFPSSIDVRHFRLGGDDPEDQINIPKPRVGFFGVIDERFDSELLGQVAALRPDISFVLLGPVVKVDPNSLPHGKNIHYLGAKSYNELPAYLHNWQVAMLPFALNASTRFISPTKTPEYLAAGKPVVSTPIHDVVLGYGNEGLVAIASDPSGFAMAIDSALGPQPPHWEAHVECKLSTNSWDHTWTSMWTEIERAAFSHPADMKRNSTPLGSGVPVSAHTAPGRTQRSDRFDYLIVGAGFAGAVLAERLATTLNKRVLVIDKRDHIAGNTYDFYNSDGILVHKYGPHIFHTNSKEVVDYLSHFTKWRPYEHRVLASVDGKLLTIPINLDTINQMYDLSLDARGMKEFLEARTITNSKIRTSEDIVVSRLGRELYEKFFRNYTRKQWGLDPSELDSSVAGRIPVRFDHDDRYFTDTFQAMPLNGYTHLFENLLDHKNITVRTGVNYAEVLNVQPTIRKIFTGPVDEYFDYRFGPLPYRSLAFRHETYNCEQYQTAAVVNYPNDHEYTRVTEFKYLTGQTTPKTSVVFEYPRAEGDPYYPIPRPENALMYGRYKELADRATDVHFVGRLATYRYYNMDQVVAQSLTTFRKICEELNSKIELQSLTHNVAGLR